MNKPNTQIRAEIGERLTEAALAVGVTDSALSKRLKEVGITPNSHTHIARVKSGTAKTPTRRWLEAVAEMLQVRSSWLMNGEGHMYLEGTASEPPDAPPVNVPPSLIAAFRRIDKAVRDQEVPPAFVSNVTSLAVFGFGLDHDPQTIDAKVADWVNRHAAGVFGKRRVHPSDLVFDIGRQFLAVAQMHFAFYDDFPDQANGLMPRRGTQSTPGNQPHPKEDQ